MMDTTTEPRASAKDRLLAEKKAREAHNGGREVVPMPVTEVEVTIPAHRPYEVMAQAQRRSKGKPDRATMLMVQAMARFDGERLTVADIEELLDGRDVTALVGAIFGDDAGESGDDAEGDAARPS